MATSDFIYGIHAVLEALDSNPRIDKIFIKRESTGASIETILKLAKESGIPVQRVPVEKLNRLTHGQHQGVVAMVSAITYCKIEEVVETLQNDGCLPFILVLDSITDVRNFGAIARTAECAGVDAIVIPDRGSVSVGADAVKTSAGALLRIPVCRVPNLAHTVTYLQEKGYNLVAVSEKASENYTQADYCQPVALVMGAEDKGIAPHIFKACNMKVSIPMFGKIESLNVSVAAAVLMYEVVRQRLDANLEVI